MTKDTGKNISKSKGSDACTGSDLFWKESEIDQIQIIGPTRLRVGSPDVMSMQMDKYLQSQGAKRIPEQQLVQFCYQICLGLMWFHENGFIYKDMRCRNVLVEKRGHNWIARLLAPGQGSLVKYRAYLCQIFAIRIVLKICSAQKTLIKILHHI